MRPAVRNLLLMGAIGGAKLKNLISNIAGLIVYWPMDDTSGILTKAINPAVALGNNICTYGDFSAATNWVADAGWVISGGVATGTTVAVGNKISQTIVGLVVGRTYKITYTISGYSAGSVRGDCGSTGTGTTRSGNGTYTENLVCATNNSFRIIATVIFTGVIDNVSVQEVNILASTDPSFAGAELTTNGEFDNFTGNVPTNWTASTNTAHSIVSQVGSGQSQGGGGTGSVNIFTDDGTGTFTQQLSITNLVAGRYYWCETNISAFSGGGVIRNGGNNSVYSLITVQGLLRFRFIALDSGITISRNGNCNITLDYIRIKEVNPLDGIQTNGVLINQSVDISKLGTSSYKFDGSNDCVNIYSEVLNSIQNTSEGSIILAFKMSGSGVYTDGLLREMVRFSADAQDMMRMAKDTTNNQILVGVTFGNVTKNVFKNPITSASWNILTLTWSKSADQVKGYLNGLQFSSTSTGLGTYIGNLAPTGVAIGSVNSTGSTPHSGNEAHLALINRPLPAAEVLSIAQAAGLA